METVLICIGAGLAGLVLVAIAVAAWENYVLLAGRFQEWPAMPPSDHAPLQPLPVDLHVDEFARPADNAASDGAKRRAALEEALVKLAQPPVPGSAPAEHPLAWENTEPMPTIGPRAEPAVRSWH